MIPRPDRLKTFASLKPAGQRIAVLTAADYPTGRLLDEAGIDMVLVGDSLGMVVLGYPDTVDVTMADMLHHVRAVCRGVQRAAVCADLPWHSYETPADAVRHARMLTEAGADCVKLEGGTAMLPQVRAIIDDGIAFVGHIGMLPQSVREEGGYRKKGKNESEAARLLSDAIALDSAGALAIVLEGIVPAVADTITARIKCPSIGIGSGPNCDGEVLVTADVVGSFPWFRPPFAKARADVAGAVATAARAYIESVKGGR
jgi:3-methyl-2-oxobutanoate hydroxymethyltransferase